MPIRFWSKRSSHKRLKARVRHIEDRSMRLMTADDINEYWTQLTVGSNLFEKVNAMRRWQELADVRIDGLEKKLVVVERKMNEEDDGVDNGREEGDGEGKEAIDDNTNDSDNDACKDSGKGFGKTAEKTNSNTQDIEKPSQNPNSCIDPTPTRSVKFADLPTTFTKRKEHSAERIVLDDESLYLLRPGSWRQVKICTPAQRSQSMVVEIGRD